MNGLFKNNFWAIVKWTIMVFLVLTNALLGSLTFLLIRADSCSISAAWDEFKQTALNL